MVVFLVNLNSINTLYQIHRHKNDVYQNFKSYDKIWITMEYALCFFAAFHSSWTAYVYLRKL